MCLSSSLPIRDLYASSCPQSLSCSQHSELEFLLQHHLFPLLLKTLSERSAFPLALRGTRIVFVLLKQFSYKLETGANVILILLIKLLTRLMPISLGLGGRGCSRWRSLPGKAFLYAHFWHTGLRMATPSSIRIYTCRLCSYAEFKRSGRQRCDTLATDGETNSA